MKVLVATDKTQGEVTGDYTYCVPGEMLWITMVCDTDRLYPERGCGCGRGFGGLVSHRATTTAEVAERDFSEDDLRLAIRTSLTDQGWLSADLSPLQAAAFVEEVAEDVRAIAEPLPVGFIVRRNLDEFHAFPPRQKT